MGITDSLFKDIIGPYGAMALLIIGIIYLYRENRILQALVASNQTLFAEALKVIREDLVPILQEMVRRR